MQQNEKKEIKFVNKIKEKINNNRSKNKKEEIKK